MTTPARLTCAQSARAARLNAELLALSRERRDFMALVHSMRWPVSHIPELWAAHVARFLGSRRAEGRLPPAAPSIAPPWTDTLPAPHLFEETTP